MCELFGLNSRRAIDSRKYLSVFYKNGVHHPHGWGLLRENKGRAQVIKEPVCAAKSSIINDIIKTTEPQRNMLAHIRLATVGTTKFDNCHPYTGLDASGRQWTLIHNGTIYSGDVLTKYLSKQKGDTDSERILLYLLDVMNENIKSNGNKPLSVEKRCHIMNELTVKLAPRNKLNFMIFDGEVLYIHKNMKDTLSYKKIKDGIIFSTQPLDEGVWERFPMTQLKAFKEGECIYEGPPHEYEFVPVLEYITVNDAMYI